MIPWFLTGYVFCLLSHLIAGHISCLNQTGQFVDWFIILKMPRSPLSKSFVAREGYGYAYLDNVTPSFRFQEQSIAHSDGSGLGLTLAQLYLNYTERDFAYFMYNDQDPSGTRWLTKGMPKGVLMFNNSTGFWLVHSVPGFPPFPERGYDYPQSARTHGHMFLCISINTFKIDVIGSLLLYNAPHFYDSYIPAVMTTWIPDFMAVLEGKSETRWWSTQTIRSIRGQRFTYFVKSSSFLRHIYPDIIALYYNSFLLVKSPFFTKKSELFRRCRLEYVTKLSLSDISFNYALDKSEWAMSKTERGALFCFGGPGKQELSKSAGSLCLTHKGLWSAFFKIIQETQGCPQLSVTHAPDVPPLTHIIPAPPKP